MQGTTMKQMLQLYGAVEIGITEVDTSHAHTG